ncbi:MAG: hypothetical protein JWP63_1697, partial [Candidatus Solibacter sp.]|nr:hypothetical protein [Candidatus Solibacter sp.]
GICLKADYATGSVRQTEFVTITDCYMSGCWPKIFILSPICSQRRRGRDATDAGRTATSFPRVRAERQHREEAPQPHKVDAARGPPRRSPSGTKCPRRDFSCGT